MQTKGNLIKKDPHFLFDISVLFYSFVLYPMILWPQLRSTDSWVHGFTHGCEYVMEHLEDSWNRIPPVIPCPARTFTDNRTSNEWKLIVFLKAQLTWQADQGSLRHLITVEQSVLTWPSICETLQNLHFKNGAPISFKDMCMCVGVTSTHSITSPLTLTSLGSSE